MLVSMFGTPCCGNGAVWSPLDNSNGQYKAMCDKVRRAVLVLLAKLCCLQIKGLT